MIEQHLKLEQLAEKLNISRTTIYFLRQRGDFPDPVQLSERRLVWAESAIEQWLLERTEK